MNISKPKRYKHLVWLFDNVNNQEICAELLNIDWDSRVFCHTDIDEIDEHCFTCFNSVIDSKIPNKLVTVRPWDKPWMDSSVRLAIRKRNRLLKIYEH